MFSRKCTKKSTTHTGIINTSQKWRVFCRLAQSPLSNLNLLTEYLLSNQAKKKLLDIQIGSIISPPEISKTDEWLFFNLLMSGLNTTLGH